jgi:hypothetical protein
VQHHFIGRIKTMKNFRRNLLLASSALALVMLFGCSSSEESSGSSGGSSACEDACRGSEVPDFQLEECLVSCDVAD